MKSATSRMRCQSGKPTWRRLRVISPSASSDFRVRLTWTGVRPTASELFLGHRKLVVVLGGEPLCIEPDGHLAQQVRHTRPGVAAPDVQYPFAEDRGIDQDGHQHGMPHRGPDAHQLVKRGARDERHLGAGQRLDAVVGDIEEEVLEVERFAGDMDRDDLPGAVVGHLLAERESRKEDGAGLRRVALAHRIG